MNYHRCLYKNHRFLEHHIEFTVSASIIEELRGAGIENTEFYPQKIESPYTNNKNAINDSIRSSKNGSNSFFDNPTPSPQIETTEFAKITKPVEIEDLPQEATVHILKPKTRSSNIKVTNSRKKVTSAEAKARRAKFLRYRQYDIPKRLSEHPSISAEEASELQFRSGRDFTLNIQNQILQDMANNRPKLKNHRFNSRGQFIAYMSKALRYELRDAVKTANINYIIKANQTKEDKQQHREYAKCEKFLNEIEQRAIAEVSPENQLKAKLANTLAANTAHNLLLRLKQFQTKDDIMEIYLHSYIELTKYEEAIILSQIQAVYGDVESIEFIMPKAELISINSHIQQGQSELSHLPKGTWGAICKKLVDMYGADTYKNWFSKLSASVDDDARTIELTAPSDFVKDWIIDKYEMQIRSIASELEIEFLGVM
jgi:hypothetical protein